ncbi:hypothetical protein [Leifsonia naganoensis]|uniref:Uncharacterized protein n=1 Tax=Leifsonia naganoensis TaxID=150025 RepID=A0A853DLT3_9MICO|nr:hypothetical protein [Leifsonia naganoensis]NYK10182.1 hypothetical protein [Leifsonia naganoensis]
MVEYKYVSLPTARKEINSSKVDEHASAELNAEYVAQGWDVVNATRPMGIGQIGFLLRRDAAPATES